MTIEGTSEGTKRNIAYPSAVLITIVQCELGLVNRPMVVMLLTPSFHPLFPSPTGK